MSVVFHDLFRSLAERNVRVHLILKNEIQISGLLHYVDAQLNLHLTDVQSSTAQLAGVTRCLIRGNTVKFISIENKDVHSELLEDLLQGQHS